MALSLVGISEEAWETHVEGLHLGWPQVGEEESEGPDKPGGSVSLGFHNKRSQTGRLKHTFVPPSCIGWKVQEQGVAS